MHWLNHHLPAPLCLEIDFLVPQVMSMVKFSPLALNFVYDFVLLVHFFGTHFRFSIFITVVVNSLECNCFNTFGLEGSVPSRKAVGGC